MYGPSSEVWAEGWLRSTNDIVTNIPESYKESPIDILADQAGDLPTDDQLEEVIGEIKAHSRYREISEKLEATLGLTLDQFFGELETPE